MVDDCSSDNSVLIAQEFVEKDHRIKLIQLEKNTGAAVARNKAIKAATGRFIAFLDRDDLWGPDKLEKQVRRLRSILEMLLSISLRWKSMEC